MEKYKQMNQSYMEENWANLTWSPWYSFNEILESSHLLPKSPGMYRIRAMGQNKFMYIGQTGRSLRERVKGLIRNTYKEKMPFNDPHTAAPSLWAWKDAESWDFECSITSVNLSKENREGLECFLLWKYRIENSESTYCNHGRFHLDYIKSKGRSSGFQGRKLNEIEPRNMAWGESFVPLSIQNTPTSLEYMGLPWSNFKDKGQLSDVPQLKGVYRIKGIETNTILYIGQSNILRNRLKDHLCKDWEQEINYSFCVFEDAKDYQLKEIENDLIGAFYSIENKVPYFQFKNLK